jgi:fatty acid CoA ligase FadD9
LRSQSIGVKHPALSSPVLSSELHSPLEGASPVFLTDFASDPASNAATRADAPRWAYATDPEPEPSWTIDLGAPTYVERIQIVLVPPPADAAVEVVVFTFHDKAGRPVAGSFRQELRGADLPRTNEALAVLDVWPDAVARFVQVTLRAAEGDVALLVRCARCLGARVFGGTLAESYARAFTLFADRPIFAAREGPSGRFAPTHRYRDVWAEAIRLAAALAVALEAEAAGERVMLGLMTQNRPEWVIADIAAVLRGYVVVPIAPDEPHEKLSEILTRVPLHAVLVDGGAGERLARLSHRCPTLRLVVTCGAEPGPFVRYTDLLAGAPEVAPPPEPRAPGDLYSILFTSGSTGVPKGAMRSYAGFHAMVESYEVAQPEAHLAFQPLSHLNERMYLPAVLFAGGLVGFPSGEDLLADLRAFSPTALGSVPRLYEVVYAGHRRRLAEALAASPGGSPARIRDRVFAETRRVFGDRLIGLSVGSAPISAEVLAFLRRAFADLSVEEGYGSTECGMIALSGKVPADVEVKLASVEGMAPSPDRGEILVRTRFLIDGYYGDPEATRASIDADGFYRTGDLGERGPDGAIRVVGRVRSTIKLAQGEFVSLDRVEAALAGCPAVDQILVCPDAASSSLQAVVVPDRSALATLLHGGVGDADPTTHPEAAWTLARALAAHGQRAGLAAWELPRAVVVEPDRWTAAAGLLTASGKLARPALLAHYRARLAALAGDALLPPAVADGAGSPAGRLAAAASAVVRRPVDPEEPIHEGLASDSLAVIELVEVASATLGREIPLSLWWKARTLADLARLLDADTIPEGHDLAVRDLGLDLPPPLPLERSASRGGRANQPFSRVLLTGATGLLGAHLLESLLARTAAHVICLARASNDEAAAARVRGALARYGIPAPDPGRWAALSADLGAADLGLDAARLRALEADTDAVLHAAGVVSWFLPYEAMRAANVLGTRALLDFSARGTVKPVHFVSTISAAPADGDEGSALSLTEARCAGGYALSKWVAEQLVRRTMSARRPAAVYRPAMITGHSRRGIGNPDDYVHRYLRTAARAGVYLDSPQRLDMTPVDHVADAIVALMLAEPEGGGTHHITNVERSLTYEEIGQAIGAAGHPCRPVSYAAFRAAALAKGSPLAPLAAYFPEEGFVLHTGPWPSEQSRSALAALGVVCPAVDAATIARELAGMGL